MSDAYRHVVFSKYQIHTIINIPVDNFYSIPRRYKNACSFTHIILSFYIYSHVIPHGNLFL